MAGIAAANTNNGTGIAGVAYSGVKIMPVQVLGADGTGQDSDIIEGVVWATDHGADVILMSSAAPATRPRCRRLSITPGTMASSWWRRPATMAPARELPSRRPWRDRRFCDQRERCPVQQQQLRAGRIPWPRPAPGSPRPTMAAGTPASPAPRPRGDRGRRGALMRADSGASNGVIAGRLARSADPAGTQDQDRQRPAQPARAITDTGTTSVKPAGAAPVGSGGPFVGRMWRREMRQLTARYAMRAPIQSAAPR